MASSITDKKYWDDIGTHGFAILDQLRNRFAKDCGGNRSEWGFSGWEVVLDSAGWR
jgi:hypothetical protein